MYGKTGYRSGGTRGGRDQFTWDSVKEDNQRNNYLGHSVKAPVGRWAKGRDLLWYAKGKGGEKVDPREAAKAEIAAVKAAEAAMMREALGYDPEPGTRVRSGLDDDDKKRIFKKGEHERDAVDAERAAGIGAAPLPEFAPKASNADRMAAKLERSRESGASEQQVGDSAGAMHVEPAAGHGAGDVEPSEGRSSDKTARKLARKQKKKAKKELKKAKKEAKKERKHSRRSHHDKRGHSSSSSEESDDEHVGRAGLGFGGSSAPASSRRHRSRSRSKSPSKDTKSYRDRDSSRHRRRSRSRSHSRSRGHPSRRDDRTRRNDGRHDRRHDDYDRDYARRDRRRSSRSRSRSPARRRRD